MRTILNFPRWLYAGIVFIVICVAGLLALRNTDQQREQMIANLKDRADVLIWALEGSARAMGRMGQNHLPELLEEIGDEPDVAYMAILDGQGRILIHSDSAESGNLRRLPPLHEEMDKEPSVSRGTFITDGEKPLYEVWKIFAPKRPGPVFAPGDPRLTRRWLHPTRKWPWDEGRFYIAVGMDASHFEPRLRRYVAQTMMMAALITAAGLAGIALLFFFQNYKRSRRMLEDTQALAEQVISNLPVGLVVTDLHGKISLRNRPAEQILGIPHEQENHPPLQDLTFFDWRSLMDELDSGGLILEKELDAFASKTRNMPVSLSAAKLTDSEGGKSGYLFILRDLDEVRRLRRQVKLNERLSALGNLAAGVAHEIRNPLSSIKGYATYLTEKVKEDKMAHATGMILIQETDRLNRVVSDLLSVAKPLNLRIESASITPLLQQAIRLITPEAEENMVTVELDLPPEQTPQKDRIMLDADRFTQALLNLLVNAVQAAGGAGSGGTVRLTLEKTAEHGGPEFLAVSVSDNGQGIAPRDMENLFTPYFTTKATGTGLGLTIAQRIIEQHGGEIKVYSRQGQGATFTILLPVTAEPRGSDA